MNILTENVGSGIKIRELVDSLVAAEGQEKTKKFNKDEATALAKISGIGLLKSSLSDFESQLEIFQNTNPFASRATSATLANSQAIISAKADASADVGNYQIIVSNVACSQKSSSTNFAEYYTNVGTGTLTFSVGTASYDYEITSSNQTVQGIRDTINLDSDITGIKATLITTNSGTSMVFSAQTGTNYAFTVSVTNDGDSNNTDNAGLSQLASTNLTLLQAAEDASLTIEGVPVSSSSNTIENAILGVSIDLLNTNVGTPVTLSVNVDVESAQAAVLNFVDSYNNIFTVIDSLTESVPGDRKNKSGVFIGDSSLRGLQYQMRQIISTIVTTQPPGFTTLSQIGITSDQYSGKLVINKSQLTEAFNNNFSAVGTLFTDSDNGLITNMDDCMESYIEINGILQSKTDTLRSALNAIDEQKINLERHLKSLEKRLLGKFITMDMIVARLKSLREYLSTQLDNLPKPMSTSK